MRTVYKSVQGFIQISPASREFSQTLVKNRNILCTTGIQCHPGPLKLELFPAFGKGKRKTRQWGNKESLETHLIQNQDLIVPIITLTEPL